MKIDVEKFEKLEKQLFADKEEMRKKARFEKLVKNMSENFEFLAQKVHAHSLKSVHAILTAGDFFGKLEFDEFKKLWVAARLKNKETYKKLKAEWDKEKEKLEKEKLERKAARAAKKAQNSTASPQKVENEPQKVESTPPEPAENLSLVNNKKENEPFTMEKTQPKIENTPPQPAEAQKKNGDFGALDKQQKISFLLEVLTRGNSYLQQNENLVSLLEKGLFAIAEKQQDDLEKIYVNIRDRSVKNEIFQENLNAILTAFQNRPPQPEVYIADWGAFLKTIFFGVPLAYPIWQKICKNNNFLRDFCDRAAKKLPASVLIVFS